jgi:sugar lactone lactonase YvrE
MPGDGPIAASGGMLGFAASPAGGMVGVGGRATLQQYESELLAGHQQAPGNLAVNATHAYWANRDGANVMRVALAGGMPEVVADAQPHPHAVAIDGQFAYFTTDYDIRRVPLAGGTAQVLAEELKPSTIAVDESHVYWVKAAEGIGRMSLEGAEPITFASDDGAAELLLDADDVYWTTASAVKKQSKSGSVAVVLADTSASRGAALSGDYLYWVHDSVVERVTKDGLKREKVLDTGPLPQGVAADGTTVYFATGYGQVMRAALNEPKPYVVASNQNGPWVVASDASFVYWIEAVSSGARIQRFAK